MVPPSLSCPRHIELIVAFRQINLSMNDTNAALQVEVFWYFSGLVRAANLWNCALSVTGPQAVSPVDASHSKMLLSRSMRPWGAIWRRMFWASGQYVVHGLSRIPTLALDTCETANNATQLSSNRQTPPWTTTSRPCWLLAAPIQSNVTCVAARTNGSGGGRVQLFCYKHESGVRSLFPGYVTAL